MVVTEDGTLDGSWLCPLCAECHSCGEQRLNEKEGYEYAVAAPSGKCKYPVYLATYCKKCHDRFENDSLCPVCLKTYLDDDEENEMVACDTCDHWIHAGCDESLTPEKYQELCDDETAKYNCPLCVDNIKPLVQSGSAVLTLKELSIPGGYCVGLLGGKIRVRGAIRYKTFRVGVPEIKGTGLAEMPSLPL
ncbi:PHD finger protein 10 [Apophysomyces sp. BC1034]|nr:PHD finger protein 10 [Apophysomyces sp. BC1034]